MTPFRLHYIGLFRSPVSWAKVNREFVLALDRAGGEVSVTPLKGLHYDEEFPVPARLEELFDRPRVAKVEMAMEYPENLWKLEGETNVTWVLYETDLPRKWAESYQRHADLYVCPSSFVHRKAVEAGLEEGRTSVVPFGVNMNHYHTGVEGNMFDGENRVILTVGPPHKRKGFRELIRGFCRAFSREDSVTLYVKTYDRASPDHLFPWEFDLDAFLKRETGPGSPDVHVDRSAMSEGEMARLFRSSDVFVLPSYGEAFGLSVLESMAVGTPVVGVDHAPVSEMVNERNGWLIDGETSELSGLAYDQDGPCTFCVPSAEDLGNTLRSIMDHPGRIRSRSEAAVETARNWSWDRSAERFLERMQAHLESGQ